jgi:hypothetical protein
MWKTAPGTEDTPDRKTRKGEPVQERAMCQHIPTCPGSQDQARDAARVVSGHPEQGWSLLCNGVILFEDTGELLPDCTAIGPHRGCEGKACHGVPAVPLHASTPSFGARMLQPSAA